MNTKKKYSPTQISGFEAEKIACDYLCKLGLKLIRKNYTTPLGEIDLIMEDQQTLIFIEVRKRKSNSVVTSAESITIFKQKKIIRAASLYLNQHPSTKPCRIDVVAIDSLTENGEINWIKDAFQVE